MNYVSTNWLHGLTTRTVYRSSMGHTSERRKHAIYGQTTVHTLPGKHAVQPDDKTDCYAECSQTIGHTDSKIAFKEKKKKHSTCVSSLRYSCTIIGRQVAHCSVRSVD